jgi:hypothetical protein
MHQVFLFQLESRIYPLVINTDILAGKDFFFIEENDIKSGIIIITKTKQFLHIHLLDLSVTMSSAIVNSLKLATNQSTIYGGFFLFIIGTIGNVLNIIIFTSLKTFRETSTAFYLRVTSGVNIFQLIVGLLTRILITGYNIDPTKTSEFLCKARIFTLTTTMLISFTCKCFAVIDQYLSLTNRWRHLCNVKVAICLVIFSSLLWCLHGISFAILEGVYPVSSTNQTSCSIANPIFNIYTSRFLLPVVLGLLPLFIRIIFGLLAFINVRSLKNRRAPIVRLERDKQLTAMV